MYQPLDDASDGAALVHDKEAAADTEGEHYHPAGVHKALREGFKQVHQRRWIGGDGVKGIGVNDFPSGGGVRHPGVLPGGDDVA
nr:hypothetical protein [Hungatella hathewayi]